MSQTKFCSVCQTKKPIEDFAQKGKKGRNHQCKQCKSTWNRQHYLENKQYYYNKARRRDRELRAFISNLKVQCGRCQENHPACLQFHHKDPNAKEFSICEAVRSSWGLQRILDEIEKCEVLCANCHAKEHWQDQAA